MNHDQINALREACHGSPPVAWLTIGGLRFRLFVQELKISARLERGGYAANLTVSGGGPIVLPEPSEVLEEDDDEESSEPDRDAINSALTIELARLAVGDACLHESDCCQCAACEMWEAFGVRLREKGFLADSPPAYVWEEYRSELEALRNQRESKSPTFTLDELRSAVDEACFCGGSGQGEGECPACEVWHELHGRPPAEEG